MIILFVGLLHIVKHEDVLVVGFHEVALAGNLLDGLRVLLQLNM